MAVQGIKRIYNDGRVNYAIVHYDDDADYVKEEGVGYKQELCDIEEVVKSQYQGCAWLTTEE
jgi:predicted adenine nucleotide alpha hydrolase (AANH) superfamily ATPase